MPAGRPTKYNDVLIDDLVPYKNNARTHSDTQINQILESIQEFGFTNPILIDQNKGIIAGHGRLMAAQKLGMKKVPCYELTGLTEAQKKAYVIADNQLALNAGWDLDLLKLEVNELKDIDFNIDLLGFDDKFIENLLAEVGDGLTDEDDTPDDAPTIANTGDLWQLGNHRLYIGDSTDHKTVSALLGDIKPHLMVTDPPYGVEYDANWRNEADRANGKPIGAKALAPVKNDNQADWSDAWVLFEGDVAYVWHDGLKASEVAENLQKYDFILRSQIIWAKNNFAISRGDYHWQHEACWYAVKKRKKGHYIGNRSQSTIWNIDKPMKSETGHSTQKPVECMRRPMQNNSSEGQAVYDPFLGSGTSIIAAETIGRHCYGLEINPEYGDIIIKRWEDFTGNKAELLLNTNMKEVANG